MYKMGKKEVFTRIDEELYKNIKKKGYKLSELIKLGYEYKEKQGDILTEDGIKKILDELREVNNEFRETLKVVKILKIKISEIEEFIRNSRSKIASKLFPSKYDMINILSELERKLQELKEYI